MVIELAAFDKGGLETVVLNSALAFGRDRIETVIVTPGPVGHLGGIARAAGLDVVKLPRYRAQAAYRTLLDRFAPHLAISHLSDTGYRLFARHGIPNITFIHGIYVNLPAPQRAALLHNDRYVARYVAVSEKAAHYASGCIGLPADKIVTIPNGLIIAEHEARARRPIALTRAELGLRESDYVFIHPAQYNLHKGHYLIAAALRRICMARDDIKVLCVGNDVYPPHVAALRAYIQEQGLGRHMLMPGFFPHIEDPMRVADACLLPSFMEGWSIAMNEAMFYAKPLILTDTGGAAEVIEGNDIGILLPTEYPDIASLDSAGLDRLAYTPREYRLTELLADAMVAFADDRARWAEAGQRARRKLYERYDFGSAVRAYESLMFEVAGRVTESDEDMAMAEPRGAEAL